MAIAMHRLLICVSAAVLMMPILPAQSDEYPVLNVQPLCRGIVSQSDTPLQAGDRSVSLDECLKAEQDDRATMIKEWSQFSASDRKNCIAEATAGGEFELYGSSFLPRNGSRCQAAEATNC